MPAFPRFLRCAARPVFLLALALAMVLPGEAAEKHFDLTGFTINEPPPGFVSTVTGSGQPGNWRVLEEDLAGGAAGSSPNAPIWKRRVIAQLSEDATDEHFPLLIYNGETFGDFTVTTRFKNLRGVVEQMAGIAFRFQNPSNYYVLRASSGGNSFRFYKFVDGKRSAPIGPEVTIPAGVWHEMAVECKGNQIRCQLNGKEMIPPLTDNTFAAGKIGFWTKSDAVSYFTDTRIVYVPREPLAQKLVDDLMRQYPRLVGLKIVGTAADSALRVLASTEKKDIGKAGGDAEKRVIDGGQIYHGKTKGALTLVMPLHDRNGERVAALRIAMKPFAGQTEQNAVARALPMIKTIEGRIQSAKDLLE